MNAVNGGSFAVTAAKRGQRTHANRVVIDWMLAQEERMGLGTPEPYRDFEERVFKHREDLRRLLHALAADGKKIVGYGASTKGNVVLQFCGITEKEVIAIAEVNADKFGAFTPGTHIPIISEAEARAMKPDYFLVLPWHFKDGIRPARTGLSGKRRPDDLSISGDRDRMNARIGTRATLRHEYALRSLRQQQGAELRRLSIWTCDFGRVAQIHEVSLCVLRIDLPGALSEAVNASRPVAICLQLSIPSTMPWLKRRAVRGICMVRTSARSMKSPKRLPTLRLMNSLTFISHRTRPFS